MANTGKVISSKLSIHFGNYMAKWTALSGRRFDYIYLAEVTPAVFIFTRLALKHFTQLKYFLSLLDFTSLISNNKIHVVVTPWIGIKFQSYSCVISHAFVMFSPTEKLACSKICVVFGSYFPVNMFLFKSLPQRIRRSENANSNKLISHCYHSAGLGLLGHSNISSKSNKTKQEQNGDHEQSSNSECT